MCPKYCQNSNIEHFLDLSNPTVTKLLKSMEKERWILRKFDQSDLRKKLIGLTEKSFMLLSTENQ
ncbi:MarR family transcriptional regulator [Streptococcus parasanguinis]|uniref:MarR family transcriptional regulator n=1 Tax=Streptococcus TaxID=1301 RepID=UPI0039C361D6